MIICWLFPPRNLPPNKSAGKVETVFPVVEVELVIDGPAIRAAVASHEPLSKPNPSPCAFLVRIRTTAFTESVVACSRVAYHFHALYVVRRELFQLRAASHFSSVDVDFRCSSSEYIHCSFFSLRYPVSCRAGRCLYRTFPIRCPQL